MTDSATVDRFRTWAALRPSKSSCRTSSTCAGAASSIARRPAAVIVTYAPRPSSGLASLVTSPREAMRPTRRETQLFSHAKPSPSSKARSRPSGMAMKVDDEVPSGIVHINEQTVGDEADVPRRGGRIGHRIPLRRRPGEHRGVHRKSVRHRAPTSAMIDDAPHHAEMRIVDPEDTMQKESLTALVRHHLATARAASSGRSAHTVYGGHEHVLRQTLIALRAGSSLDEHENPGEATVQVLRWARHTGGRREPVERLTWRPHVHPRLPPRSRFRRGLGGAADGRQATPARLGTRTP